VTADTFAAAKHSPHLEIFRKKGVEVLLLTAKVDEWLVSHLTEYSGKTLQSVAKGSLDLPDVEDEKAKEEQKEAEKQYHDVVERLKKVLTDRVKEVRMTSRLTASPACIVADDMDFGLQMQRILKAAGQKMPSSKPILELNPNHDLIKRLQTEEAHFDDWAHILLDQAILAEGGQLDDPAQFVQRMNQLLIAG